MVEKRLTVVQMLPALDGGGVERGTIDLAKELVKRGHRSIVISADGRMLPELLDTGSEHYCWDVGAKRLGVFFWIRKVRQLLRDESPDILHLRSRLPAWIGYFAWKKLPASNRPHLVTTVHGPYSVSGYSAVMTKGERVIAVSEMIRSYILKNYPDVNPEHIQVIHRGVSREKFNQDYRPDAEWLDSWYRQYPQLKGQFVVTLPGRLTRWKGQEDFIRIIKSLVDQGVGLHGLIVGGAHPRKTDYVHELEGLITENNLDSHITLTGHRSDLRDIMAVSDVVYSLSTEPEAFGRTTIEALSLGVPVIGYAHGGVAEQLEQVLPKGAVGVGDESAVAELTKQWKHQKPLVAKEHPFTLENMLGQTITLYERLAFGER